MLKPKIHFQLQVQRFISMRDGNIFTDNKIYHFRVTPFAYQVLRNIQKGDILKIKGLSHFVVEGIEGQSLLDGSLQITILTR